MEQKVMHTDGFTAWTEDHEADLGDFVGGWHCLQCGQQTIWVAGDTSENVYVDGCQVCPGDGLLVATCRCGRSNDIGCPHCLHKWWTQSHCVDCGRFLPKQPDA